jgi:uncharacterized protein (DUF2235 family)
MARKLALFFDGTWNHPGCRTNVWTLFKLTASDQQFRGTMGRTATEVTGPGGSPSQLTFYHPGVGAKWGEKIRGGAFGYGLSRNIRDGLLWLAQQYQPGDDLYFFGFSRGAYTARSLVGLIRKCGIPRTATEGFAKEAYHIYREKQWSPDGREAFAFRNTFSWPNLRVKFIGVWDTVGALGIPVHEVPFSSDYYRFFDTDLSRMVDHAYHALALDEHRHDFAPTLWSSSKTAGRANVEQRWFPGAHADVGGGYKDGGLAQLSLQWMQQKAKACDLAFVSDVQVKPLAYLAPMHDSFREFVLGLYKRMPWAFPYYRPRRMGINETVDDSVWHRMESADGFDERGNRYAPPAMRSHAPHGTVSTAAATIHP